MIHYSHNSEPSDDQRKSPKEIQASNQKEKIDFSLTNSEENILSQNLLTSQSYIVGN